MASQKTHVPRFCIMAISLALLASNIYLPSLPLISADLASSAEGAQNTVALNFLGMGLSNLLYGPLADVYGRRPVMLLGFGIFCLFSLGCACATDIYFLSLFRFLVGCGAGVALGLGITMVNDIYEGMEAAQIMAKMTFAIILAPACAPLLGGYLTVFFGWRSTFLACLILGIGLWILMWLKLPETAQPFEKRPFSLAHSLKSYGRALKHRPFMSYVLSQGALFCGLWAYQTVAPFIFISHLGIPVEHYGYYGASISVSHGVGGLIAHRLIGQHGNEHLLRWGFHIALASSVFLLMIAYCFPPSAVMATVAAALYAVSMAFVIPSAIAKSMEIMAEQKGTASALLISARMSLAFCGAAIGGLITEISFVPVALFMVLITTSAIGMRAAVLKHSNAHP